MKKTRWFPPEVKPVHVGVYEWRNTVFPYHKWDGKQWCDPSSDVTGAYREQGIAGEKYEHICLEAWRGLAEKPE